jgi:hypothetical protein
VLAWFPGRAKLGGDPVAMTRAVREQSAETCEVTSALLLPRHSGDCCVRPRRTAPVGSRWAWRQPASASRRSDWVARGHADSSWAAPRVASRSRLIVPRARAAAERDWPHSRSVAFRVIVPTGLAPGFLPAGPASADVTPLASAGAIEFAIGCLGGSRLPTFGRRTLDAPDRDQLQAGTHDDAAQPSATAGPGSGAAIRRSDDPRQLACALSRARAVSLAA